MKRNKDRKNPVLVEEGEEKAKLYHIYHNLLNLCPTCGRISNNVYQYDTIYGFDASQSINLVILKLSHRLFFL